MRTFFISDLHLHPKRPQATRAFLQFLAEKIQAFDHLYILGDFFDAWIGDDDDDPFVLDIISALKKSVDNHCSIFFMRGNRDFLIGENFSKKSGVKILEEPCVITLADEKILLLHGDSLCVDDSAYQEFRALVRSPEWQAQVLSQSLENRRALAAKLREQSQAMNSLKAEDIMDVNQDEVIRMMRSTNTLRLIHGHTHRPARHKMSIDGNSAERIVLGDWDQNAWALVVDNSSIELIHWTI